MATLAPHAQRREILGHPSGLFVLFFAEMWERFSYYGMRALLILYLTKHWLFSDARSNIIYASYGSLVYITPVLGGYLADRYLGQRKAVTFGAILLTIGHFLMAFEGNGGKGDGTISVFWAALAFIIVGSGFLKANISVIVGQLYPRTDPRRDGAYTIFYIGINMGAFIGTLIAGYLGETYGWSYGFGAAGFGMLLGLIVFVWGKPTLLGRGEPPEPERLKQRIAGLPLEALIYASGVAAIAVCWGLIQYQEVIQTLLIVAGLALLGYVMWVSLKLERQARDRMLAILFLIALNPVFWALFEQAGGSLNLFTDRFVDRAGVPASLFQSVNPGYILLFGPVLAWIWTTLGRRGIDPSAPAKFGLGLVQLGFGFLVLVWGAMSAGIGNATPVIFIFLVYLFHTTGELCLSPVGLSAMNRLAPRHLASLIMGAWFFAIAGGQFLAGQIGAATGGKGGAMTKAGTLAVYSTIGWWTIGIGLAVIAVSPFVKRLMHLDALTDDVDRDPDPRPEEGMHGCDAVWRTRMTRLVTIVALMALAGCATKPAAKPQTVSAKATPVKWNSDPYPSTYKPYPSTPTAIRGATVYDGEGGRIERGVVFMSGGKITSVGGPDTVIPDGTTIIDGTGKFVTPGIIDIHSHLGDYPSPAVEASSDGNEATGPVRPEVWAEHSVWPQDPGFSRALVNGGVTSLEILPGSANLFGGRSVVLKNVYARTTQGMKFPGAPYGLKMACGENPKRVYGSKGQMPATRMGNIAVDRQTWARAVEYKRKLDKGGDVTRDIAMDTLAGVLAGDILVQNHCYRADEMANVIDMSKEFGYHVTAFHHAVEAYKIADLLKANNVCAVMWADWWGFKMESYDAIPENIALVQNAGACAMIHSDDPNGIQRLNQEAAKALASGRRAGIKISDEVAWQWLSYNPAKALGIAAKTGSLKTGKMADVVLWNGNPFSVYVRPERVWIDGALMYDANDPRRRPVSDFELGQPGEGDVK